MSGHAGFVFAAYAASALVIGAMIAMDRARPARPQGRTGRAGRGGRQTPLGRAMSESPVTKPSRRNWLALLPLILFLGLAAIFLTQLMSGRDTQTIPSALIGQPVPVTNLPPIEALGSIPGIAPEDFKGKVTVLNVFASWCAPCRDEHPVLMELAKDKRLQLIAINYKDKPENAAAFPRRTRQSLRQDRLGCVRPRRHRLGRLWRAGDLCDRPGRRDPV